jgi:hypothetical protein
MELIKITIDDITFELPKKLIFAAIDIHELSNTFEINTAIEKNKYLLYSHIVSIDSDDENEVEDEEAVPVIEEDEILENYVSVQINGIEVIVTAYEDFWAALSGLKLVMEKRVRFANFKLTMDDLDVEITRNKNTLEIRSFAANITFDIKTQKRLMQDLFTGRIPYITLPPGMKKLFSMLK